jgi:hypothetical protein
LNVLLNHPIFLRTEFFWAITQHVVVFLTHVSGQPVGPSLDSLPLKTGLIGCPETSVRN